jgi:hypothetical protein
MIYIIKRINEDDEDSDKYEFSTNTVLVLYMSTRIIVLYQYNGTSTVLFSIT